MQRSETVWATLQLCIALCIHSGLQQTDRQTLRLRSMDPWGSLSAGTVQAPCDFGADFFIPLPCNSFFMEFYLGGNGFYCKVKRYFLHRLHYLFIIKTIKSLRKRLNNFPSPKEVFIKRLIKSTHS